MRSIRCGPSSATASLTDRISSASRRRPKPRSARMSASMRRRRWSAGPSVDDRKLTAVQEIDGALKQRGFQRDWELPFPCYQGTLDSDDLRINISIEIHDTDFVKAPLVRLERSGDARLKPL